MRRFLAFAVLLVISLPIGLSVTGCGHNPGDYCIKNGHAYGIKTTQVTKVILQPETTGVSLSWGQTYQVGPAEAYNCLNGSESVGKWIYNSSNLLLADISPGGTLCAGTWNRNSPGGAPNFTICTPPSGSTLTNFQGCTGSSCGIVQVTAQGAGVTSNPVDVYIHPPVTSVTIPTQKACVSQGQNLSGSLLAETTVLGPGGKTLCSPTTTSCDTPAANIGTINYQAVTNNIATINNTTNPTGTNGATDVNPNGIVTANLPGSTVINAKLSNSDVTSAAGFFSTCPPVKINLTVNGGTTGTVKPSSPQTVVASAVDQNGHTVNGLALNFASTEPQNLAVSGTGLVTSTFPSHATITAICQPPDCNPAPVNLVGTLGNGMPIAGNTVTINSPGRVSDQVWMASSQSPYFSEVDLTTGGTAAPVRLPYTPNSMVMDDSGTDLYFGSYHELMIYSTYNNSLAREVTAVPGVVLAVAPQNNMVVINDQLRQVIYLYDPAGGSNGVVTSIAGIANRAEFTPDGNTVYIAGEDPATKENTLFVYNASTGWSTYSLTNSAPYSCALEATGTSAAPAYNPAYDPFCGQSVAVTVPSVAAFLSGTSTDAHSYCPNVTATPPYYPPAGDFPVPTTQLAATADGQHIVGADLSTFTDMLMLQSSPSSTSAGGPPGVPVNACPDYNATTPMTMPTSFQSQALPAGVTPSEIDQVVSSPYANLAFVTYQGTGATGLLPYYVPTPTTATTTTVTFGNLSTIQLSAGAQAPVAGAFAPDGALFFVSTSGDNLVHEIDTGALKDTGTIDPRLVNNSGQAVPPQFIAVKSRSTT